MPNLAELDPVTARRFRTGRPCLDFVHTGGVGKWTAAELIHDARDLGRWLAFVLETDQVTARSKDLPPAIELRESLWQLAQQRVAGEPLDAAHVAVVNAAAARRSIAPQLTLDGRGWQPIRTTGSRALAALARDAVDLFAGPFAHRIRTCAAPDCGFLFVDSSRPGRRRWCSMQRCGNRTKVRTYRSRIDQRTGDRARSLA